jgi:hypothetical protein
VKAVCAIYIVVQKSSEHFLNIGAAIMSGSTESQRNFLSRRGFFGWASSLAAALGMAPLAISAKALSDDHQRGRYVYHADGRLHASGSFDGGAEICASSSALARAAAEGG